MANGSESLSHKRDTLTLEEFIIQHNEDINNSNELCQQAYENRLKHELGQWASTVEDTSPKKDSNTGLWKKACKLISDSLQVQRAFQASISIKEETLAADLLSGTTKLDQVTEHFPPSEETANLCRTVHNVVEEFQGLFEEAFLLLNAPKTGSPEGGLSYHHEKEARDIQLSAFYNEVVGDKSKEKYPSMSLIVDKYEDVCVAVQCFMRCQASKAKRVTVVFNGHGNVTGHLSLEREHDPPTNSKVLEDIYDLWRTNKEKDREQDMLLPSKITVVFAQCYGFLYTQKPEHSHVIDVVSLASPREPRTKYSFDFAISEHSNAEYIERSVHVELSEYARQRSDDSSGYESNQSSARSSFSSVDGDLPGASSRPSPELFIPSLFLSLALPSVDQPKEGVVKERQDVKRSHSDTQHVLRKCHRLSQSWRKSSDASASSLVSSMNMMSLAQPTHEKKEKSKFGFNKKKKKKAESPPSALCALARSTFGTLGTPEKSRSDGM